MIYIRDLTLMYKQKGHEEMFFKKLKNYKKYPLF